MIAEAIDMVAKLSAKADTPKRIETGDDREIAYAIGGRVERFGAKPERRAHKLSELVEVIRLANRLVGDQELTTDPPAPMPSVWYSDSQVVLVFDDDDRREQAVFDLHPSDVFARVCKLRGLDWLEQKAFIRLLRVELAGTLEPVHLLEKVRRVKFEAGSTTTGEVRRDRESLGREITQRAESAEGEIPEEVTLQVPIYSDRGERAPCPIRCAVEVDAGRGAFRLVPLPDEIERAQTMAVESIADRLHGDLRTELIYHGQP